MGLNGCNDSFLERYPETSITEDGFFNNASDLEAYTNGLYGNITSGYTDVPSDNMIYTESQNIYSMMPFIASMIILAFTSKNSQAPKAEGIPYDKGAR